MLQFFGTLPKILENVPTMSEHNWRFLKPRGRGGTPRQFGWACAAHSFKPLPYLRPKYVIFPTLLTQNSIPYFRPVQEPLTLLRRWEDKKVATSKNHTQFQTRSLKPNPISSIPYFRLKWLEHHTLWCCSYLYSLYKGVPCPPLGFLRCFDNFLMLPKTSEQIFKHNIQYQFTWLFFSF